MKVGGEKRSKYDCLWIQKDYHVQRDSEYIFVISHTVHQASRQMRTFALLQAPKQTNKGLRISIPWLHILYFIRLTAVQNEALKHLVQILSYFYF